MTDYNQVFTMDKEAAIAQGKYQVIGQEADDAYMEELKKQVLHMDAIKAEGRNLKIVYTPLHGTGNLPARRILKELGFENVYVVPEQELPDGNFPIRRQTKPSHWGWSWPGKWMQTWCWPLTRMQTVWECG